MLVTTKIGREDVYNVRPSIKLNNPFDYMILQGQVKH